MRDVLEFVAVLVIGIAPAIRGMVITIRKPTWIKHFSPYDLAFRDLLHSAACIMVVTLIASDRPNGLASIGVYIQDVERNGSAAFVGAISILLVFLVMAGLRYVLTRQIRPAIDPANPSVMVLAMYRGAGQRALCLAALFLGVVAEEIVYRGYLVLFLSRGDWLFGAVWATFSIILSVIIHLYQGRSVELVLTHGLMTLGFVVSTFLAQNLAAAIAPHLLNNIIFAVRTWLYVDRTIPAQLLTNNDQIGTRLNGFLIAFSVLIMALVYCAFFACFGGNC